MEKKKKKKEAQKFLVVGINNGFNLTIQTILMD